MNYCPTCAAPIQKQTPKGDNRLRNVCSDPKCASVHYENPRIVTGTVTTDERGYILLCKRAIEPRYGYWTLPAGFMELAETMAEGALRETTEEAGAQAEILGLYSVIDVPHAGQVHTFYRAKLLHPDFTPGEESLEAKLFAPADIPWDDIAFKTVSKTLRWFLADTEHNLAHNAAHGITSEAMQHSMHSKGVFPLRTSAVYYTAKPTIAP